jgi:hypothetical protein
MAQTSDEDRSLGAQLYKYYSIFSGLLTDQACKFTDCGDDGGAMGLVKMWHLMKAHRKRTKITKVISN